jgi:hypothetical protein
MAAASTPRIVCRMGGTYAAIWAHRNQTSHVGSVELVNEGIRLLDATPRNRDDRVVGFGEIAHVRMGSPAERLADLKTVVVQTATGHELRIAALGLGAAVELAQLLAQILQGPAGL